MNIEIDEKLIEAVRKARDKQRTRDRIPEECRCGPTWDFAECDVCIAKKALAEHVLEKAAKPLV